AIATANAYVFWPGFEAIPPAHAPYTVALSADPNGRVTCVGHLIAPSVVLTTASCLAHSIHYAAVGATVILNTTNAETIQVAHTVAHPAFDAATHANDVGLIQLAHPSAAAPVAISWDVVDAYEAATLRGWGQLGDGTKVNNGLMETSSSVWANTDCAFVYAKVAGPNSISDSVLCAGGETAQACVGDAGDALTILGDDGQDQLVGLFSWSVECDAEGVPGVFTRLSSVRDFVEPVLI
ncbi:hypothetical protein As57867_006438, partial [Aphanomyces stellatus]